jgi:hypothetical protein
VLVGSRDIDDHVVVVGFRVSNLMFDIAWEPADEK